MVSVTDVTSVHESNWTQPSVLSLRKTWPDHKSLDGERQWVQLNNGYVTVKLREGHGFRTAHLSSTVVSLEHTICQDVLRSFNYWLSDVPTGLLGRIEKNIDKLEVTTCNLNSITAGTYLPTVVLKFRDDRI